MKIRIAMTLAFALFFPVLFSRTARAQEPVREDVTARPQSPGADAPDLGQYVPPVAPGALLLAIAPAHPEPPYEFPGSLSSDLRKQNARKFFDKMSRHRKTIVEITLRSGTSLEGWVVAVTADRFTLLEASTRQETTVSFDDLRDWQQLAPTSGELARNVLALAGLELVQIALFPFMILASLAGWDGC